MLERLVHDLKFAAGLSLVAYRDTKSQRVGQALLKCQNVGIAAEGEGLIVAYDYRAKTKASLPDNIRDAIAALESS